MHDSSDDLTYSGGKVRLYVETPLAAAAEIALDEPQSHYLRVVLRAKSGDQIRLFNGCDGEWGAELRLLGKRAVQAVCIASLRAQVSVPDLWLLFAPVKRAPIDYLIEKATELGVSLLQPVMTRRTTVRRVNLERLKAHAIEAAEQSDRLSVPELREPISLDHAFGQWDSARKLMYCDESGQGTPVVKALSAAQGSGKWAVLTGPEGGFDEEEQGRLSSLRFVYPVSLGPRILRADTAALAALAVWQSLLGDWR